jgi:hypothetical protein
MQNQTSNFTSGTESTLHIRVFQGKKDVVLTIRHNDGVKNVGRKDYFELTPEGEAKAQEAFDARVQEAVKAGWVPAVATTRTRAQAFTAIPPAPQAPGVKRPDVAVVGGSVSAAPRAAAKR